MSDEIRNGAFVRDEEFDVRQGEFLLAFGFLFLIELSARKVCSDCPYYNILSSENAKSATAPQQGTGMLGQIVWNSLLPWYFLMNAVL
jgi:hypothetical protein